MNAAITNTGIDSQNEIRFIELKNLYISPENVRVVSTSKDEDKRLLASLKAQGLLQNLVVIESITQAGKYEVVAGGRRYGGLVILNESGDIPDTYQVFCKVKSREIATAVSLSENIKASMHPADEFLAFQKLNLEGKSEKQIAAEFGTSTNHVKKLLKLASVAPELVQAFREGKMNLECIMAFTVSGNHERQLGCWKDVNRSNLSPYTIRSYLLKDTVSDDDEEVLFVGLKVYKQAGGAVSSDLFENTTHCLDLPLLSKLVDEKLSAEVEKIASEGWKWVETSREGNRASHGFINLKADFEKVPKKLESDISDVQAKIDNLNAKDVEIWTEDDDDELNELESKLEDLLQSKESYRAFTKDQKSLSGCIVTFNYEGKLQIFRGLARKEDIHKQQASAQDSGATGMNDLDSAPVESNTLMTDLNAYYAQAFQAELLKHEDLAYDLMVFSAATSVLSTGGYHRGILDFTIRSQHLQGVGIEDTKAKHFIDEAETQLNTSWAAFGSEGEQFDAFRSLSKAEKSKILTFCVARSSFAKPTKAQNDLSRTLARSVDFSMNQYWTATADNYYGRVKRDVLLEIGEKVVTPEFKSIHEKSKKTDLAKLLDGLPETNLWLPETYL